MADFIHYLYTKSKKLRLNGIQIIFDIEDMDFQKPLYLFGDNIIGSKDTETLKNGHKSLLEFMYCLMFTHRKHNLLFTRR